MFAGIGLNPTEVVGLSRSDLVMRVHIIRNFGLAGKSTSRTNCAGKSECGTEAKCWYPVHYGFSCCFIELYRAGDCGTRPAIQSVSANATT